MKNYWLIPNLLITIEVDYIYQYQLSQPFQKANVWKFDHLAVGEKVHITGCCLYNGLNMLYTWQCDLIAEKTDEFLLSTPDDLYQVLIDLG